MASKTDRPQGRASERIRSDGTKVYEARVSIPLGTGLRSRRYKSFATAKERDAWLRRMLTSVEDQTAIARSDVGVADYIDAWITDTEAEHERSTTTEYRGQVTRYVRPMLGNVQLQRLSEVAVRRFIEELSKKPGRTGTKTLSPATVHRVFGLLRKALEEARKRRLVAVNVADFARGSLPKLKEVDQLKRVQPWTMEEVRRFRAVSETDELAVVWRLALVVGLRRGEVAGLRWSDVELDGSKPTVSIRETRLTAGGKTYTGGPKTRNGRRTLRIDAKTAAVLREHRTRQVRQRLAAGPLWKGDNQLVVVKEDGTPYNPETLSRRFQVLIEREGLPHIRYHDLRAIAGSLMMAASKDVHTTSKRLGHATSSFTMDVYGILLDESDGQVADEAAGMLDG